MTITCTITTDSTTITGAQWDFDEAELRLWVDPGLPGKPRELATHRQFLDEGEELTLTLAQPGEGAGEDGHCAASASRILSEAGERAFIAAFEEAAPFGYDAIEDGDSGNPWCAPWYWARDEKWYDSIATVAEMGTRWAEECYEELEEMLNADDEEEE